MTGDPQPRAPPAASTSGLWPSGSPTICALSCTTKEIRLTIEHWIAKSKSNPNLLKKAEAVRADIERDAETRRNAIAAIFNSGSDPKARHSSPGSRSTGTSKSSQSCGLARS